MLGFLEDSPDLVGECSSKSGDWLYKAGKFL